MGGGGGGPTNPSSLISHLASVDVKQEVYLLTESVLAGLAWPSCSSDPDPQPDPQPGLWDCLAAFAKLQILWCFQAAS